jgi:hypothetical protein
MLCGETVSVYCEKHTEHTDTIFVQNSEFVPHRIHITSPLQSITSSCCLGKEPLFISSTIRTHRNTVWAERRVFSSQETQHVSSTMPNPLMLYVETVAVYGENHNDIIFVGRM